MSPINIIGMVLVGTMLAQGIGLSVAHYHRTGEQSLWYMVYSLWWAMWLGVGIYQATQ